MARSQYWIHWSTLGTTNTEWHPVQGGVVTGSTTEGDVLTFTPGAGKLRSLSVVLDTAPGAGNSRKFEVVINGTPNATLTLTISDAATTGEVTGEDVDVSADSIITVKETPTSGPTAANVIIVLEFQPTTADQFVYTASSQVSSSTAPRFAPLIQGYHTTMPGSDGVGAQSLSPISGTIKSFHVKLQTAPGSGKSYGFILVVDGSEVGSELTIADLATSGSQTGLSQAVTAGQTLGFKVKTATSSPAATRLGWAVVFEPSTSGRSILCANEPDAPNASATRFLGGFGASNGNILTAETAGQVPTPSPVEAIIQSLYAKFTTAPGATRSRAFKVRDNGADGTVTFSIADANVAGNDTGHSDTISAGQPFNLSTTPTNTPTDPADMAFGLELTLPDYTVPTFGILPLRRPLRVFQRRF